MAEQVILAIGDACGPPDDNRGARDVARLAGEIVAENRDDKILLLGDNAYGSGSKEEYEQHFKPLFGDPFAGRLHACAGNRDYRTAGASAYFAALGPAAAGTSDKSYYSFSRGDWHIVSLNSEIEQDQDSPQLRWLRDDLANRSNKPILAFWASAALGFWRAQGFEEASLVL